MKNYETTLKNHETTLKNHGNQPKTMEKHEITYPLIQKRDRYSQGGPSDLLDV